jgi:hypothetical protein
MGPRLGWLGMGLGLALLGLESVLESLLGLVSLRILAKRKNDDVIPSGAAFQAKRGISRMQMKLGAKKGRTIDLSS